MAKHMTRAFALTVTMTFMVVFSGDRAQAQHGPDESRNWQFLSPGERSVRAGIAEFYERGRRGGFSAPTFNTTTNVAGDQYICDVSATATGNSGFTSNTGQSGAPTVLNTPSLDVAATGNLGNLDVLGPLNGGGSTADSRQQNTGSSQSAALNGTSIGGVSDRVSGSTNSTSVTGATNQSALNSPQTATITSSTACSTTNVASRTR
jgi:hypothetical protein